MKVLILANGDPPSEELARRLAGEHDLMLAVDGAAHRAAGLGIAPDIICGDFDSAQVDVARREFPDAEFVRTPDQDYADLEKALRLACERGAASITILGAAGGRMDHTLGNFALLLRHSAGVTMRIADDRGEVWALVATAGSPAEQTISAKLGDTLSLVSFDGAARVTLAGVRWPLHDHVLPIGTHGVSNVAVSERVFVRAESGAVFVCHLQGESRT